MKNFTPHTGNSINMRTRARKSLEPVVYDVAEQSLRQQLKTIKREKVSIIISQIHNCAVK